MRAVFQLPASMTSVVDAPRAVSSDASPTRPLCAVKRAEVGPSGVEADTRVGEPARGRRGGGQRPRRVGASGDCGLFGLRCSLKHNGNYQSQ